MSALMGRTIVITGAAGMLGRRWVNHAEAQGAHVFAVDRQIDPALVNSDRIYWYPADVTSQTDMQRAAEFALRVYGHISGLVCAAGLDAKPGTPGSEPFEALDLDSWRRAVDVNLTGTALACQAFGSRMAERGGGSIVTVASLYAVVAPDQRIYPEGWFKPAAYSASKAGVIGLTRWLASYWGPRQVRVNAVVLGGVLQAGTPPEFREAYQARTPLGRMANVWTYDELIAFLLGDGSRYMTGAVVTADGGYTVL